MKSILKKKNRRSKKTKRSKSVSFKKNIVEEFLIPRVGKSKKVNPYKRKKACYTKYVKSEFKTKY